MLGKNTPAREYLFPLPRTTERRQIYGYAVEDEWLNTYAIENNLDGPEYNYPLNAITHIINTNNLERRLWSVWVGEGKDRKEVYAFAVGSNRSREVMATTITSKRVEKLQRILGQTELPSWLVLSS